MHGGRASNNGSRRLLPFLFFQGYKIRQLPNSGRLMIINIIIVAAESGEKSPITAEINCDHRQSMWSKSTNFRQRIRRVELDTTKHDFFFGIRRLERKDTSNCDKLTVATEVNSEDPIKCGLYRFDRFPLISFPNDEGTIITA